MAVTQTGAIYKSLSFDNTSSRSYGVYITGEAVYNAPEREVEMISIPGRNGSFALDKGRFENIEVTYPAGIFANNETDFAAAISDFRNFLCSKNGYCRLTDEYNPNEYRMAVYKSGLEVDPAQLRAGEFDITFNCKPQRYLTSGETATTVANNGTMTNPTLFDSSPLLAVKGYGNISFNGSTISVINDTMGEVIVSNGGVNTATLNSSLYNTGDAIYGKNDQYGTIAQLTVKITPKSGYLHTSGGSTRSFTLSIRDSFTAGTTASKTKTDNTYTGEVYKVSVGTGTTYSYSISASITLAYNATNNTLTATPSASASGSGASYITVTTECKIYTVYANSSKNSLGNPTYIDLDLGEAYKIENNEVISSNNIVTIPAELPTLAPGTNTFTKDNTITELKVTPRWWKV